MMTQLRTDAKTESLISSDLVLFDLIPPSVIK